MDLFYTSAAEVAQHLLEGLASHLGLPRRHFAPSFEPHTSYLRLNYYPACPEPSTLSVNRHTDAGALTVLLQENGTTALQVCMCVGTLCVLALCLLLHGQAAWAEVSCLVQCRLC